jgi:hypothetical protein
MEFCVFLQEETEETVEHLRDSVFSVAGSQSNVQCVFELLVAT